MNYCPPPEPPMVGEYIQNFVGEPSGWMQARKCRDGSWVVNSIGKDGKVIGTITIPAPEQDKK